MAEPGIKLIFTNDLINIIQNQVCNFDLSFYTLKQFPLKN